jgi:hypothetical protein
MALCFGPRMLLLGGACMAGAVAGLLPVGIAYEIFGSIDGILELRFGYGYFPQNRSVPHYKCA